MTIGDSRLARGAIFADRYEILAWLGAGGFGSVYKARQQTTGQPVALKLMRLPEHDGASQPQAKVDAQVDARVNTKTDKRIARFLRETRLCAQLHHPNIVQLIDSGQTDDGLLYMVFAFVPGDNLADFLAREGALHPGEARHLMLQVLDALACAHARGVVHRDLKPRNIMVIPTGARRNALVLDFGIGAMIDEIEGTDEASSRLTGTAEALGTPGYAAPEQLRGLDPSPAADVFAWGLVFLECLAGKPVYTGASVAEILYAQIGPEPVPMPEILEHHPLGEILRDATRKDRATRTLSAAELLVALEQCPMGGLGGLGMGEAPGSDGTGERRAGMPGLWSRTFLLDTSLPRGRRRQITALCCTVDMAGNRTGNLPGDAPGGAIGAKPADDAPNINIEDIEDIEEQDDRLRARLGLCVEVAHGHGGHVAGVFGDQVLLYFGYPRAREDDARRAARAALAIAAAARVGSDPSAAAMEPALQIGVHTGLVVARDEPHGPGTGLAAGTTPRLAARVAALAPPGGVVVTAATRRLLGAGFAIDAAGNHPVAGVAEPIKLFQLRGEHAGQAATTTPDDRLAGLYGRDQELELLMERWRRAADGTGQCSLITGEPGIGKSRLAREQREHLSGDAHTYFECRCSPDTQNSALYPIVELLGRLVDREAGGPTTPGALPLAAGIVADPAAPADRSRALEALLVRHGLTPAQTMPLLAPLLALAAGYPAIEVSPERHKELTLAALLSLLFAMAEERPVFLLVEDLHWADPTTIELLTELVREAPSAPMCALFTARPEFSPPFPTMGMLQLHLSRLEPRHIEGMVVELVNGEPLSESVLAQVVSRTDGVPLFVEELIRMMLESGALALRGGRYELAGAAAEAQIPATLRALLTARLDRLGRARDTAQLAAALGREFTGELLGAVSPLDTAAVDEDLGKLSVAGLVHRRRRLGARGYIFKHALIRDAAYESVPKSERKAVHGRIAAVLEAEFAEVVASRPAELARHHAAAGQMPRAIEYAQKAAQAELGRSANAEAIAHARQALGWLDAGSGAVRDTELALNGVLIPALMASQSYVAPELVAAMTRSQELLEAAGDQSPHAIPTLWALVTYHHVRSHRAEARALAERLVALAEGGGDVGHLAAALVPLGSCLWIEGRFAEARDVLERALSLYDPEAHRGYGTMLGLDPGAWAGMTLGPVLWALGYPEQALRRVADALAWAEELGHANTVALGLIYLASLHYLNRDRRATGEAADRLLRLCERHGLAFNEAFGRLLGGWAAGEVEQSRRILADNAATGQMLGATLYRSLVAESLAAAGQYDAALAEVEACLRLADEQGEHYHDATLHRLAGTLVLKRDPGAAGEAEACFRRAIATAQAQGAALLELEASSALAGLLAGRGERDEACALVAASRERMDEGDWAAALVEAKALQGELGR